MLSILQSEAIVIALFKPQFEVGKGQVGKGGVVRNEALRQQVVEEFLAYSQDIGLTLIGALDSPVLGKKGNQEVLVVLKKGRVVSASEDVV